MSTLFPEGAGRGSFPVCAVRMIRSKSHRLASFHATARSCVTTGTLAHLP